MLLNEKKTVKILKPEQNLLKKNTPKEVEVTRIFYFFRLNKRPCSAHTFLGNFCVSSLDC